MAGLLLVLETTRAIVNKKEQTVMRLIVVIGLTVLAACTPQQSEEIPQQSTGIKIDASTFAAQVGIVAYTSLSQASQSAQIMDNKLASFMYHPNPMSQKEITQSWRQAYDNFLHTLVFAYLPIQDPPGWHTQRIAYNDLLIQLDSWPIEGGYIDYIPGYPFSGIVNDLTLNIDEKNIRSQHGFTDPTNASLGYHAIEFMFWGYQGKRTAHDFFPQENTAPVPINDAEESLHDDEHVIVDNEDLLHIPQNHNRRRQYTKLLSEILQKDLHRVQRRWEPSGGYYAQLLQQSSIENTLQAAFIAGQRFISEELLQKRFQLISSEFSNSSQQDLLALLSGLELWYLPKEEEQQEASLGFLMQQANNQIATDFILSLTTSKKCIEKMTSKIEDINQCKQDTIGLLSNLRRSAVSLNIELPALD
jgi:putative iron-regulated protein